MLESSNLEMLPFSLNSILLPFMVCGLLYARPKLVLDGVAAKAESEKIQNAAKPILHVV
jgi:hypothetical protein